MRYFVGAIVLSLLLGSASSAVAQDKEKSKSGMPPLRPGSQGPRVNQRLQRP